MDRDGLISNGELFLVLKMMVGNNLKDQQLQQIVDKTIMEADKDGWVESFTLLCSRWVFLTTFTLQRWEAGLQRISRNDWQHGYCKTIDVGGE
jgi:hypothetical protein